MTAAVAVEDARAGFGQLRMEGVTRRFGPSVALDGVDLRIEGGEFLALLGPSGCGKSTALNCLAGLLPLSAGEIWLDDERIDGLPPPSGGARNRTSAEQDRDRRSAATADFRNPGHGARCWCYRL
ncbi:ATP-binding cassette domain-containing protein [Actinomadura rugatobispora]|uniref:ATP-binding cassette domain-containing protein n=1 Tax=Actinomadura rugatobispora TaxID=1994 RepID=A0ABW1ABR3_9ACTN|nr:hypothetical protein GCM10010200_005280 [Actinomadura rugatobispora]